MLKILLALLLVSLGVPELADARKGPRLSGRVRQTLAEMIDPHTGKIRALPIQCGAAFAPSSTNEVKILCDAANRLRVSRDGQQYEDLGSTDASGGIQPPSEALVGDIPMFGTTDARSLEVSNIRQNSDGSITITGTLEVTERITTGGATGLAFRKYAVGDPANCGAIVGSDGTISIINPSAGGVSICDEGTAVSLGGADAEFNWSVNAWTDGECWQGDGSLYGADGGCGNSAAESSRAMQDLTITKFCAFINAPATEIPDGEGADIELYVNSVVIDTIELNGADTFDQQGETACTTVSIAVLAGQAVQIRSTENATTCETGSGCVLDVNANVYATAYWTFD